MAGGPVEVQPDELQLSFQMQRQAAFDAVPLDPRSCLGPGLKLCTYRRWFSRPAHQVCPVYWEVPMSTAKLQRILRFRMGSHLLPIEQGRHLRLPRHRRVCRLCHTGALGDKRHMLLECPALADLRDEYSLLVAECSGVMAIGLCGPETSPWSAGTSLLASIECHADDRQTLFHPFSLVG